MGILIIKIRWPWDLISLMEFLLEFLIRWHICIEMALGDLCEKQKNAIDINHFHKMHLQLLLYATTAISWYFNSIDKETAHNRIITIKKS